MNKANLHRVVNLLFCAGFALSLVLAAFVHISPSAAQTTDANWTEPVNLSHSGSASAPVIVRDSDGVTYVVWHDEFSGAVFTSGDGSEWSQPEAVEFPFGDFKPTLVADSSGTIHAFWVDDLGALYYSRVNSRDFSVSTSWAGTQQLSDSALDFDVAVDSEDGVHLAYVRPLESSESPAGIYYMSMSKSSGAWSDRELLYKSPYFRSLSLEDTNVEIDVGEPKDSKQVYVVWDNRPRERVFFAKSNNGGKNWEDPVEVAKPEEGSVTGGPANIMVYAQGNEALLLWQTDRSEASCNQLYEWSADRGDNWQKPTQLFEDLVICPQNIQILDGKGGPILMLSAVSTYLQAWNSKQWSDPQAQPQLTSFVDPETQQLVNLGCQDALLVNGGELDVVGCDNSGTGDIWFMKRPLLDIASWFPQAPVWDPPNIITTSTIGFADPTIVADAEGRVHALWVEKDNYVSSSPGAPIYYARWESGQWSVPESVLLSPTGKASQPDAAVNSKGSLMVVWSGGQAGEIYFSQAEAARAGVADAWASPVRLPSPQPVGSSPDILIGPDNKIYVVYAIPLNEERGIYLTISDDDGASWSTPVRVFDAVAAGWEMVDSPKLALTGNGHLHVLWTRYSLPSGPGPMSMYYSRSEDGGQSWSNPETVVDKPVGWSSLAGVSKQTVHRVWQELGSGGTTIWHEQSNDDGATWVRTAPVSVFGDIVNQPSLTWDSAGRLDLMQIVSRGESNFILQHFLYDGSTWSSEQSLNLNSLSLNSLGSLVADVSSKGNLVILFTGLSGDVSAGTEQDDLIFTRRSMDLPQGEATPAPIVATAAPTTSTSTEDVAATATPQLTTPTLAATAGRYPLTPTPLGSFTSGPRPPANTSFMATLGPIVLVLVVFVVIVVGVVIYRSGIIQL